MQRTPPSRHIVPVLLGLALGAAIVAALRPGSSTAGTAGPETRGAPALATDPGSEADPEPAPGSSPMLDTGFAAPGLPSALSVGLPAGIRPEQVQTIHDPAPEDLPRGGDADAASDDALK